MNQINEKEFQDKILKAKIAIVDFNAVWCPPCKILTPIMEEVEKNFPNIVFAGLDVDQNQMTAAAYGVMSIPTVILFKNGVEADRFVGAMPKAQVLNWVKQKSQQ
ncbi:MAG: thioredoxin [Candidatus Marsarchaeota archaeon]|nr:thioredoxin [Candidatus Marsarchaeota archaeon]